MGHVTYFRNFGTPSISQKLLKLETSNLVRRLATSGPKQKKMQNSRSKRVVKGSRYLLLEFWDPSISWERLKLETSNLASRLATGRPKQNNAKLGQNGSISGHVTYFWNFGTPSIPQKLLKLETSNIVRRLATSGPKQKMWN